MEPYHLAILKAPALAYLLKLHGILLFPSETETFGNVLFEAMASGLVTVSYDYAASARHGVHGINGLKAVKGDAGGFVELAMEALRLAFDPTLREAARTTAAAHGWSAVVARFDEILREVVGFHLPPSSRWAGYIGAGTYRCRTVFLSDTPEDKHIGGIHYLNTGDWVVNLTAIIEQEDGTLELVRYPEFMERNASQPALTDQPDPPRGSPLVTEGTGAVTAAAGNSTAGRQPG